MGEDRRVNGEKRPLKGVARRMPRWIPLRGRMFVLGVMASILMSIGASTAVADTGITSFSALPASTQAGGHPDIEINTTFNNHVFVNGELVEEPSNPCACDDARVIRTELPTGFIGNPHAVPACSLAEFGTRTCPPEAQVGIADFLLGQVPIFNMQPHPEQAGLLGFDVPLVNAPAFIILSARTGSDYGLNAESSPIFHLLPIDELHIYLWGVPSAPIHDANRWPTPTPGFCGFGGHYPSPCFAPVSANSPLNPYLQNPTSCGVPLTSGLDIEYYTHELVQAEAPWPATTGCDQLSFNPSLSAQPTTSQADSASGLEVDLRVPQTQSPDVPSPSELRSTVVTLPDGVSINPNAADGKLACSDSEGAFGTENEAKCPETAKVGTLELDSSALPGPIFGGIYLGEPQPGSKYRLFLTADGFATHVKLAGTVQAGMSSGQLKVSFDELPQSPFQELKMHFFGSERGLLATPSACGSYEVDSEFVPWDGALPSQKAQSFFNIETGPGGTPCPGSTRPFTPSFEAGTADNTAGAHSPFSVRVARGDGEQNLVGVTVSAPPGFAATLSGIPYCPQAAIDRLAQQSYSGFAEQASPACPAESEVGTASAGTGAGSHPLYTPGKVYLAGPYKGAPLSLETVVPAVSGPYDLGNVTVRSAVYVNPLTAAVTTVSDPIPQVLEGVPLRLRTLQISLDRPGFAVNPTNCSPFDVTGRLLGDQGGAWTQRAQFQVANCTDLTFSPKLSLSLSGSTRRAGNPAIRAVLRAGPGEANINRVSTALPPSELLDNAHIKAPCTRVQYAAEACPSESIIGSAVADTPLLADPLQGPVYLRTSNHKLPDLVVALNGQIAVELVGRIDTARNGALRTTFESVPDAPVSKFVLNLTGGERGLILNSTNLCKASPRAVVKMIGQNGRQANQKTALHTNCASVPRSTRSQKPARDGSIDHGQK